MESGSSDPRTPGEPERLEAARGHFRDAMGSVRNLAQLLASVRVGPRSIESVLPGVRDSCGAIEAHARTLLLALAEGLPDRAAIDELLAWIVPRTRDLERELAAALGKPVNAKARLGLERVVTQLCGELEAGRSLVDLLDEAVRGGRVRLDLGDLLRHARASHDDGARIEVRVASDLAGEALAKARVISVIMGVGASLVHQQRAATPLIRLEAEPSGPALVIVPGNASGESVLLPTLPIVLPTLACAEAAARAFDARLGWDADAPRFSLHLPA
jgi:hypothetical protein